MAYLLRLQRKSDYLLMKKVRLYMYGFKNRGRKNVWSDSEDIALNDMVNKLNWTIKQMGAAFDCHPLDILTRLKALGLPTKMEDRNVVNEMGRKRKRKHNRIMNTLTMKRP